MSVDSGKAAASQSATQAASIPAATPSVTMHASASSAAEGQLRSSPASMAGCASVPYGVGTTILICQPEKPSLWEGMLTSAPSLVMSALAFGLSIRSFFYTRTKDARARRQSIQDDFWLRKVVSPNSIEPFVKYTTELRATLPTAGITTNKESAQTLWSNLSTKLSELVAGFQLLDLVDDKLTPKIQEQLDVIDEELATYCGNFIAMLNEQSDGTTPDRSASLIKIAGAQKAIFELIHAHQSALGSDTEDVPLRSG